MRRAMNWKTVVLTLMVFCLLLFVFNSQRNGLTGSNTRVEELEFQFKNLRKLVEIKQSQQDVVIYNRVPKTGSTSFAGLSYDLCLRNHFNVIHINVTKNSHVFSISDQNVSLDGYGDWPFYETPLDVSVSSSHYDHRDSILIYNRVPKTGSTTLANIMYDSCQTLHYSVIYVRAEQNAHVYSVSDQMRFVKNVTQWSEKKPVLYHGHLAYLDFARFGVTMRPIYINLIREPLDRLISYYYFLRHGDDFRPTLKRRKSHNKETFDECVEKDGHDCDPENLWMQIPFFCGHAAQCWDAGSAWALDMAKLNLVNSYLLVGVTEEMGDFVAVLEAALPRFFTGATQLYNSGSKSHLRRTFNKTPPSEETLSRIKASEIYRMEKNFYNFAKQQFDFVKRKTFELKDGFLQEKPQQFMYEKIRPR